MSLESILSFFLLCWVLPPSCRFEMQQSDGSLSVPGGLDRLPTGQMAGTSPLVPAEAPSWAHSDDRGWLGPGLLCQGDSAPHRMEATVEDLPVRLLWEHADR